MFLVPMDFSCWPPSYLPELMEAERKQRDRERFMALSPEQQELELKLRAVEALEKIASMQPQINVKSSIL